MAYYYSIPIEEMEEELESLRFYPVNLVFRNKPVKEWVYERKLPRSPNHFVRIYTGIQRYGQSAGESRKAGKDAIRIQVIYRDAKGETLVSQTKRVHRVGGWRKNLHKRMDEVATELPQVEFDSRGEPMTLRKKGKNQFWGSRDYPKFKETKPFRAEEIRCCKECDKTTGLTTIQAGTYCYDCLPINLGAEDEDDEWGNSPIHEINSMEELIEIFESRKGKKGRWSRANPRFLDSHLFRINFSGVYSCRVIGGPSKIMFGMDMLDDLNKGWNMQQKLSPVWWSAKLRKYRKIVSAETPYIPKNNEATLEELITTIDKKRKGWLSRGTKNLLVFDMKDIVFAFERRAGWSGKLPPNSNWRQLSQWSDLGNRHHHLSEHEIEIVGGIPPTNIVYQSLPSEPYNYADAATTESVKRNWNPNNLSWKQFAAEGGNPVIADFKNMSKKERDTYAPDNWKIEMYWAADGSTYILRRIFKPESYGAVVDLIDEINVIAAELDHHALITFDKERVMVQLWTHDVHNITELDIAFAELLNQFADKWELNAESPEWDDIDWKTDKPPVKEHEDWGDDVEWDAESYLERDSRVRRELDEGLLRAGRDMPMQKYEYRRIKKFNTPEELHEFANNGKGWRDNWGQDKHNNYVYVCDFDWYVKRVTNNPIYTLYGHIIPLSNFSSGWSDQSRRDDKLVKRYGAPIFVQSPVMGKIMTTLKDVGKISDEKMGQSNSPMVGHGMKGLTMKLNPDEDSVLIINMKGLKFAYGKGYFGEFSDIMVLGGLPVKNVVGHRYKKPEYRALNEQRHWKVTMDREDFARMNDSQYNRGFGSEDEEITMKEFDDTTADDFVDDADDRIVLMLRKKSKINRYGDIGCPVCGSIGLFYEEIIAKGKKWYCYGCLYEDKEETIKGKGDITLEKYGLEITCPICKKAVKAFNNDSMLRHMKKCGVPK